MLTARATAIATDTRAPIGLAAAALASCAVVAVADPENGAYPLCPTRALLGIDCPLCGSLRGVHDLTRARFAEAMNHNLLLVAVVPLAVVAWLRWWRASATGGRVAPLPRWMVPTGVTVMLVYAVLRNLPISGLGWLDSA